MPRVSKVVTRNGDEGNTSTADRRHIRKSSERIEVIGTIDELNALVGLLRCAIPSGEDSSEDDEFLEITQNHLFNIGGGLAMGESMMPADAVEMLDSEIEAHNDELPPLKEFVLPQGSEATVRAHVCRTVTRRVERSLVRLVDQEDLPAAVEALPYINRLSDYFFVLSRSLSAAAGATEAQWSKPPKPETN
ncbi:MULTISPECIES: cob(I)yrinic acid a,c-diamide adenosyltransferase [unclassified Thioalkalivibrio]|uniref:cob(I)yrinic acid a,c-diamide adenosyltransferase n=1 Tax=unclassified Thioalkalivibrio TaxID=2621013 RepID=UPI00037E792C|nr:MULTISPECIES: cob(I)yrinic acid a,c-diamide adenosyltransferase [unclassified Thioalkalivibrio]